LDTNRTLAAVKMKKIKPKAKPVSTSADKTLVNIVSKPASRKKSQSTYMPTTFDAEKKKAIRKPIIMNRAALLNVINAPYVGIRNIISDIT
jgi:hypothetical protein